MSGHNPHGYLGQQINQTWNHLQVPAFIPRQPQLAHMSNERPIRTPLSWPTPAHSAELYGYMSAAAAAASNHKSSPLDMNPLLPAFVRSSTNPMIPFGSVDLSLPSRNSLTPSPRSLVSPSAASTPTINHNNPINPCMELDEGKLSRNNHSEVHPTMVKPTPTITDLQAAFFNSIVENSLNMNSNNVPDTHGQNNEVLSFASKELPKPCKNNEPMELVKEQNNFKVNSHENSNQINSTEPLLKSISQQTDQMFNAPLPGIPPHLSEISKSLLSIINNATNSQMLLPSMLPTQTNTPPLPLNPSAPLNFLPQQSHVDNEQNSGSKSLSLKPVTTNDDSLDSLISLGNGDEHDLKKVRCRRRKPQKTVRMTSDHPTPELEQQPLQTFGHTISSNSDRHIDAKNSIDNGNGLVNYPPSNHSQSIPSKTVTNYNQSTPQTQSMDLSNHCVVTDSHNAFRNGDAFSELPLKLANNMRNDLNGFSENKIFTRDFNSIGRTMDFPSSKFNPLNTDDLVKKVEEIVKCSNMNGSLDLQHTEHQTNIEQQQIAQMKLSGKENGINLSPKTNLPAIVAPSTNTNYDDAKCNGNNHHISHTEDIEMKQAEHTEHEKKIIIATENENIRNADNVEDSPMLPVAEAKIPEPLPMSNSTPKDDSSFEEIKANLQNIFADIEEDEKTTFEKTSSSLNSDLNSSERSKDENELKDSERENDTNASTNSENQVKESEQKESGPSSNSDNKDSGSNNGKHSNNGDEKIDNNSSTTRQVVSSNSTTSSSNGQNRPNTSKRTFRKKTAAKRNRSLNGKGKKKIVGGGDNLKNGNKNEATGKTDKNSKVKDELSDNAAKFRGPYIQIQKDGTEVVVNAPKTEEVAEKQSKIKNTVVKHHDRNKISGLHVSTLSNKYDADTRDTTWMCVFCKLGPHKYGLGDLFGPFIMSTTSEDYQLSQIDPKEDAFKSHRTKANMVRCKEVYVTPSKNIATTSSNSNQISSKKKRKISELECATASTSAAISSFKPDIFYGMTKSINDSYEVWAHEDCVVWSAGVHIIGARIVGLEAAVWGSTRHQCTICSQYGAVLSCFNRKCAEEAHAPCAQRSQWLLDEKNFKIRCNKHKTSDEEE